MTSLVATSAMCKGMTSKRTTQRGHTSFASPATITRLKLPLVSTRSAPMRTRTPLRPVASTANSSGSESGYDMQAPATAFPNTQWPVQKALPKESLYPLDQAQHASNLNLNLVEFVHWLAFPLGFYIASYIFIQAPIIATYLGNDTSRVFFLMLGLLCQTMGGLCGIQMHMYEGWQVTPFRNLLVLPPTPTSVAEPTTTEVNDTRVPNYNNAWLRAVAYHILFTFQAVGLGFFSLGVFGYTPAMKALLAVTVFIALIWRRKPQLSEAQPQWFWSLFCTRKVNGVTYPIMPLSAWLFVIFIINTLVNLWAYKSFFGPVIATVWPPSILPFLAPLKSEWWGVFPPLIVAAGGFIEGYFAETTFDQRIHGLAVVIMLLGVGVHYPVYWHMVQLAKAGLGM